MKKKLLSPIELKQFRLQQEEQRKFRAAELERKRLEEEKNNKKLVSPKELLDPKPVVEEIKEEPVIVEEPKDSIEVLRERLEEVASAIKEPKYYDEELAQLEVLIANKVELDEFNLEPINLKVQELQEYVSQLPKVKYYDEDLEKLTERVDQLQISGSEIFQQHGENLKEIKKVIHQMLEDLVKLDKREIPEAFDPTDIHNDIVSAKETFYERVAEIKKELSELPEVKYYDDELTQLQERIEAVRDSIPEIPEIKYYDDDLENLLGLIEEVRGNIPELPEVKYYENEISQLEEAIKNVEDRIPTVPEIRYYDDDIESLREQIKGVEGQIPEVPDIPEIKYYDDEIKILSEDIDKVRDSLINIKLAIRAVEKSVEDVEGREIPEAFDPTGLQIEIEKAFKEIEKLKEQPVTVKEDADPLLPLDQNFVTFDDLATHYRTFINRIQQQLTSLGGGGETRLEFLDDVDRNSAKTNGYVLQYDSSVGKFIGTSYVAGSGSGQSYWSEVNAGIYTTGNVAIGTDTVSVGSTALWVQGDSQVVGKLTVSDLYFDGSAYTEINAGISTLNITSSTITIGSTLQPSLDSVYDLGSIDRQWKELYLSGATLYLAGVPISLTSNVNNRTTIAVGGTSLVSEPEFQAVDQQVQFLTTGVANVGFYDADLGVISTLTEIGTKTGIYTKGQALSNVGIVTGHYFIVSKGGNNIGVGNTFIQSGITSAYTGDWIAGISTTQWGVLSYSSSNIVPLSNNSLNLGGQLPNYYLNYNNFVNTPTALSEFTNDTGFVTSSIVNGYATQVYVNNLVGVSTFSGDYTDLTNTPTALSEFSNDVGFLTTGGSASNLLNLTGATQGTYGNSSVVPQIVVDSNGRIESITPVEIIGGSGGGGGSTIKVRDNNNVVGTASTLNFGQDLDVTLTGEVATINVSIPLSALTDVNTSNLSGISTDYLMVYDPSVPGFKFVDPKTYFGINNDANPDPTIDDFGSY